jgi:C4-dicarboxylate-specific signal transduction histidine kinase
LLNLLTNAIEALSGVPPEQRVMVVSTAAAEQGSARICVQDHGPGIAENSLEALFEPFHTTKSRGRGLGLAVSRAILTLHGGRIWAENNHENGVRLCIEFPPAE